MDAEFAEAFDDYVRTHGERLIRVAYLMTGDRLTAEDVVQTAFASALGSWRRLRDVSNLDAYMYTVVVNTQRGWWRRLRGRSETAFEHVPDRGVPDATGHVETRTDVVRALALLPPRQRAAVVLRYYDDLTEQQTAAVLGCTVGTVKSQTSRALAALRRILGPDRPPEAVTRTGIARPGVPRTAGAPGTGWSAR